MEGISVYLTGKEREALIDVCDRIWGIDTADERLDNGLGSALYKLYSGLNGQEDYEEYSNKNRRKKEQ